MKKFYTPKTHREQTSNFSLRHFFTPKNIENKQATFSSDISLRLKNREQTSNFSLRHFYTPEKHKEQTSNFSLRHFYTPKKHREQTRIFSLWGSLIKLAECPVVVMQFTSLGQFQAFLFFLWRNSIRLA